MACSSSARVEQTELVSLGVTHHDVGRIPRLADIGPCRTSRRERIDGFVLIIRVQVEVQSILPLLDLGHRDEEERRTLSLSQ
ncbi:hypothetical protein XF36_23495 [Pseudonocardia sp. HH130629-09]|nr:hypothetical protein XF36_23495 [Pseudonocardia sp. HH130629-09]